MSLPLPSSSPDPNPLCALHPAILHPAVCRPSLIVICALPSRGIPPAAFTVQNNGRHTTPRPAASCESQGLVEIRPHTAYSSLLPLAPTLANRPGASSPSGPVPPFSSRTSQRHTARPLPHLGPLGHHALSPSRTQAPARPQRRIRLFPQRPTAPTLSPRAVLQRPGSTCTCNPVSLRSPRHSAASTASGAPRRCFPSSPHPTDVCSGPGSAMDERLIV